MVWSAVADARQNQKPYAAEFRVVRPDGSVRWITARGKFYYADDSDAVRMLGMAVDITERKMAEEALTSLSGRLIEAQEEERRRIAGEIHDDYNQRLAVLAIDLEELAENTAPIQIPEVGPRLHELWNRVCELGVDLHVLSHRLHSSTLQNLGLVAGATAFCEEFTDQQQIVGRLYARRTFLLVFQKMLSLCLFRILQEGLRNVKKHSGADRAEIRLEVVGEKASSLNFRSWEGL